MPGTDHHYKEFLEVFGRETDESARPSLKTGKDRNAKIPFNVVKQHATNTNLLLECAECNKLRLVFSAKKLSAAEKKLFNRVMSDMLYTCSVSLLEFKNANNQNGQQLSILEKCFVRANHTFFKPVEALYYSVGYSDYCCHCGCKRHLIKAANEYTMCRPCKQIKQNSSYEA